MSDLAVGHHADCIAVHDVEILDCHDVWYSVYAGAYAAKTSGSNVIPTDWAADLTGAASDSTETPTAHVILKNNHDIPISN